jgi:hypothetical protein
LEQQEAIEAFLSGDALKTDALAGTGKTTTLKGMTEATSKTGTYMAFNKDAADSARKKFPQNVECASINAFANRALRASGYDGGKLAFSMNGSRVADALGLPDGKTAFGRAMHSEPGDPPIMLTRRAYGQAIRETVTRFCNSDDPEITAQHVPFRDLLAKIDPRDRTLAAAMIFPPARRLWERMVDMRTDTPLGHDGTLKAWAMGKPVLRGDFAFLDEAQDSNPVTIGLFKRLPMQTIAVGDPHQQLYEFRGSRDAMKDLGFENVTSLTTSFRFGDAIADYATDVIHLLGALKPLRGNRNTISRIGPIDRPVALLARTNAGLLAAALEELEHGGRPQFAGSLRDKVKAYIAATRRLMAGKPVDEPPEFYGFENWSDLVSASAHPEGEELRTWVGLVTKYSIDDIVRAFDRCKGGEKTATLILSTGHSAKGLEWDTVRLADDFLSAVKQDKEGKLPPISSLAADLRLFYVAVTRAKLQVEIPDIVDERLRLLMEKAEPNESAA